MITTTINNKIVKLYDSIEELPILRFQKYNKFLLLDACLGSDINDMHSRIEKAIRYIKADPDSAITELRNLQQGVALINAEVTPRHLAFAALVHSIDGREKTGDTDEVFKNIIKELNGANNRIINGLFESVKKKKNRTTADSLPPIYTRVG